MALSHFIHYQYTKNAAKIKLAQRLGFDTIEEAVEIANQSIYGLSGSIITRDMNKAIKVSEMMECGGFVINGASFFRSFEQPFGGWKYSGIGNEGIMTTLKEMSTAISMNRDTLSRKLSGKSPLYLDEAFTIQRTLFPGMDVDYLFGLNTEKAG